MALVFLVVVFLQLPASLLLRFLPAPLPAPWSVAPFGLSASGTVWNGELQGLLLGGIPVRTLRWQLSPLNILRGRLQGTAKASNEGGHLDARFAVGFDGRGEVSGLQGEVPLGWLQPGIANPWRGQVRLDMATVLLGPAGPTQFAGVVDVVGLASPAVAQSLGDFRLEWPAGGAQGRVSSLRGPVELRAALLPQPGGGFLLEGEATPLADASAPVRQALTLLGAPDASGRHHLRMEFGVSARP